MKRILIAISILAFTNALLAQRPTQELRFNDFLRIVLANNLDLIIEQYEVSAAEAALAASRVFEDPELEMISPMFDNDDFSGFPRNISFELEVPIELFGKRRYRIRQARAEKYAAEATFDDFLRHLRAEAATTYIEVLAHQRIVERMNITLEQLNQLIDINKALYEVGEIGEIDLIQTRIEARNHQAELFDVLADYTELLGDVYFLMGRRTTDSLVFMGDPVMKATIANFDDLLNQTITTRSDILAAQHRVNAHEFAIRLARAERLPNISLIAGYHNEEALRPSPGFPVMYAGVVIPLTFSGFNRGEFRLSQIEFEQSQTELKATILDAEVGLHSAWNKHRLLSQKRLLFTESILQDAEKVRDAIVYSYQRGDVSLLEVLEAQRTMNETYMNYYETLSNYAKSLTELSKVSGQWLIDF
ncbi:TolC family protein [Perlabentimonas gracilis]|uniref:TolC family protein n=1 Tax=Perlabentimonas gracilis TaxID=2715279 RepID=UPI001409DC9F|nr:TolC family protein [Perlabentimonas gracilis]NHB67700.1 TolC family protein [Perlabentimonas gracilis]